MADDRMKNDDRDRNMRGTSQKKDNFSQQTPGRKQQDDDDMSTGQRGTGQQHQSGHDKEDMKRSGTGQGGRQGQNR